jgi:adenosine deaminase
MPYAERVTASLNTYRALPKVELHRHLEGSLRLDTMLDIARQHGITIPADVLRLSTLVQIQEEDKFTFQNFLKFNTLRCSIVRRCYPPHQTKPWMMHQR